jgi:predicted RNA-binding Zn ribbon-like protein
MVGEELVRVRLPGRGSSWVVAEVAPRGWPPAVPRPCWSPTGWRTRPWTCSATDLTHLAMCPVEDGGCGWMFLDRSRNRSRRWCTMEACGSFAKSRRLTGRRRAARSGYQQNG